MTNLQWFDVGRNPLTGAFPSLPNCKNLIQYNGNFCAFTGTLPTDAMLNKPNLSTFYWEGNGFTGSLPEFPSRQQAPQLNGLGLDINAFTGKIPPSICGIADGNGCRVGNDTNLDVYKANYPWILDVPGNIYECPIPNCIGKGGFCTGGADCKQQQQIDPCSPVICRPKFGWFLM